MILQALHDLYERLDSGEAANLPKPGYSLQKITFRAVIRPDGSLVEVQPVFSNVTVEDHKGKERRTAPPVSMLVPGGAKPTGKVTAKSIVKKAGLLWNDAGYMLGVELVDGELRGSESKLAALRQNHLQCEPAVEDEDFSAVCRFLERWSSKIALATPLPKKSLTGFGVFQLAGKTSYVHQSPQFKRWWAKRAAYDDATVFGRCLVTGAEGPLSRLHEPKIKKVYSAAPPPGGGHLLMSCNTLKNPAFGSYRKEQGYNAPVSDDAAFAYCCALNHLLADDWRRLRIGDATTVFWTERPTPAEIVLPCMMGLERLPENETLKQRLADVLRKIGLGQLSQDDLGDADSRFYILGLAPNASRLSVRFWHTGTLGELAAKLQAHLDDLRIVREWDETNSTRPDPLTPSAKQLLRQTLPRKQQRQSGKRGPDDAVPPLLGGALMRAILQGTPYPDALVAQIMNRIRVVEKDQQGRSLNNVTYLRAAILKAWLIRNHQQDTKPMLDENNTNPGYRLGRLFAALEKTQQDALPGINATIRDRFYSSASATPRAVFGRLLRTYQHHLAKLEGGRKTNREKLVQEIVWPLEGKPLPAHFTLADQSLFAIGYYHQRKALFTKATGENPPVASTAS